MPAKDDKKEKENVVAEYAVLNETLAPACTNTPIELQHLILDYLLYHCHINTARHFAAEAFEFDAEDTSSQLLKYRLRQRDDANQEQEDVEMSSTTSETGEEVAEYMNHDSIATSLDNATKREQIYSYVISGDLTNAIRTVESHFPNALHRNDFIRSTNPASSNMTKSNSSTTDSSTPADKEKDRVPWTRTSTVYALPTPLPTYSPAPDALALTLKPARILHLDLLIQEFIESVREAAAALSGSGSLSNAASPTSNGSNAHLSPAAYENSTSVSSNASTASAIAFSPALTQAQTLFSIASKLGDLKQKTMYQDELGDISALFLYPKLETSPVRHFLAQERRDELADRLDRACLEAIGNLTPPGIEKVARNTTVVWNQLGDLKVAMPVSAAAGQADKTEPKVRIKGFSLGHFLNDRAV